MYYIIMLKPFAAFVEEGKCYCTIFHITKDHKKELSGKLIQTKGFGITIPSFMSIIILSIVSSPTHRKTGKGGVLQLKCHVQL